MLQKTHRLDFFNQRAEGFSRSLFETFAFTTSLLGEKGTKKLTCKGNQWTFLGLLVTKARSVVMDVGGGK
jgi:hypothetical protein